MKEKDTRMKNMEEAEKSKREVAFFHLQRALSAAGCEVKEFEEVETDRGERIIIAHFPYGDKYANITADSAPTALWDVLRQIPDLRM